MAINYSGKMLFSASFFAFCSTFSAVSIKWYPVLLVAAIVRAFPVSLLNFMKTKVSMPMLPLSKLWKFLYSYIPFCKVIPKLKIIADKTTAQIKIANCLLFKMPNFTAMNLNCQGGLL